MLKQRAVNKVELLLSNIRVVVRTAHFMFTSNKCFIVIFKASDEHKSSLTQRVFLKREKTRKLFYCNFFFHFLQFLLLHNFLICWLPRCKFFSMATLMHYWQTQKSRSQLEWKNAFTLSTVQFSLAVHRGYILEKLKSTITKTHILDLN